MNSLWSLLSCRVRNRRASRTSLPPAALSTVQNGTMNYSYKGISTLKCPFDLALYSLLLWNLKPRTIIEIGSNKGGSAIWLADQLRAFAIDGHVWSYDLFSPGRRCGGPARHISLRGCWEAQ